MQQLSPNRSKVSYPPNRPRKVSFYRELSGTTYLAQNILTHNHDPLHAGDERDCDNLADPVPLLEQSIYLVYLGEGRDMRNEPVAWASMMRPTDVYGQAAADAVEGWRWYQLIWGMPRAASKHRGKKKTATHAYSLVVVLDRRHRGGFP